MEDNQREMIKNLREGQSNREGHSREYWTANDDEQLRQLFAMGVGISEIALEMNRTERAIMQRIELLKLFQPCRRHSSHSQKRDKCPYMDQCPSKDFCPNCLWKNASMQCKEADWNGTRTNM